MQQSETREDVPVLVLAGSRSPLLALCRHRFYFLLSGPPIVLVRHFSRRLCCVFLFFLYSLVSLIGLWALTKFCPKCTRKISSEQLHFRYAFAVISLLLLFSALPMAIFFKTGADQEMILAMKYNLITLGKKLRQISDLDFSQIRREINASPSP